MKAITTTAAPIIAPDYSQIDNLRHETFNRGDFRIAAIAKPLPLGFSLVDAMGRVLVVNTVCRTWAETSAKGNFSGSFVSLKGEPFNITRG